MADANRETEEFSAYFSSLDNVSQDRFKSPPPEGSAPPPVPSHRDPLLHPEMMRSSQRQQDILRGLAQLRQGLLRKQRELETDLNPLRKRHDNEQRGAPTARRT